MSFGNYTQQTSEGVASFSVPEIQVTKEPTLLTEGARLSDTITYKGNATYPVGSAFTLDLSSSNLPILGGLALDDALRIVPEEETAEDDQLADLTFSFGITHSAPEVSLRLALYDASLNRVKQYDPVTLDLSGRTVGSIEFKGFSVLFPDGISAEYAFLEGDVSSGSVDFTFKYANCVNEKSIDTSVALGQVPTRPGTDIFSIEETEVFYDASGTSAIISALQADVVTLSGDTSTNAGLIATLQTDKVAKSGDTMTGDLVFSNSKLEFLNNGMIDIYSGTTNRATDIRGYEINGNVANTPADFGLVIRGCNGTPLTYEAICQFYSPANSIGGFFAGQTGLLVNNRLSVGGDTQLVGNVAIGSIGDAEQSILDNVAGISDLSGRVSANETELVGKLNIAGGTLAGVLNMGGNKVTNGATPTIANDLATKGYVDTAIASGGSSLGQIGIYNWITTGGPNVLDITAGLLAPLVSTTGNADLRIFHLAQGSHSTHTLRVPITIGQINLKYCISAPSSTGTTSVTIAFYTDETFTTPAPSLVIRPPIANTTVTLSKAFTTGLSGSTGTTAIEINCDGNAVAGSRRWNITTGGDWTYA